MSISDLIGREPVPRLPPASERAKLRKAFGVTQAEAASALKVTRQTFNSWERGNSEPTGGNRVMYAELLSKWREKIKGD